MSETIINQLKLGKIPVDFDWNRQVHELSSIPSKIPAEPTIKQAEKIELVDEGLRDGLHGVPKYPKAEEMLKYVSAASKLGIAYMTVGIFSGRSEKGEFNPVDETIRKVLKGMYKNYPHITPSVLSLATKDSIEWLAELKEVHPKIEALVFMGTAPSRMLVEEWDQELVLEKLDWAIREAVSKYGIRVIGATEHTTQTDPYFLKKIIETQINAGADYFCIADTIGTARPIGAYRIVKFVKDVLKSMGKENIIVDWHGHRDLGNATANSLAAISAGANRIHVVSDGIGERAGNTSLQEVLLNLTEIIDGLGKHKWNLTEMSNVLNTYSGIINIERPLHGTLGQNSHKTQLGIHTAALLKAENLEKIFAEHGEENLLTTMHKMGGKIYTAIDPKTVGMQHKISVGPSSGASSVVLACRTRGIDPTRLTERRINFILKTAKRLRRELTEEELNNLLQA